MLAYDPGVYQDTLTMAYRPSEVSFSFVQTDAAFAAVVYNPYSLKDPGTWYNPPGPQSAQKFFVRQWICDGQKPIYLKAYACLKVWLENGGLYTFQYPKFLRQQPAPGQGSSMAEYKQWHKAYVSPVHGDAPSAVDFLRSSLPQKLVDLFRDNGQYSFEGLEQVASMVDGETDTEASVEYTPIASGYHFVLVEYFAQYTHTDPNVVQLVDFELEGRFRANSASQSVAVLRGVCATGGGDVPYGFVHSGGQYVAYPQSGIVLAAPQNAPMAQYAASADAYGRLTVQLDEGSVAGAAKIYVTGRKWIPPSQYLMPSVYRTSGGSERFYNAVNGLYPSPQGGTYSFTNQYAPTDPREAIATFDDISPTIKGLANAAGQLVGQVAGIAFDSPDSDALKTDSDEYLHSFFYVKLRVTDGPQGFNLFDCALPDEEMAFTLTSGNCSASSFPVMVDKVQAGGRYKFLNPVTTDEDGNLMKSGYAVESAYLGDYIPAKRTDADYVPRQQDTSTHEVWVALRKETATFGILMPNAAQGYRPAVGDTFVVTGIGFPQAYITAAEQRLDSALTAYMKQNNDEKFSFSVKFSRIFIAQNEQFAAALDENARITLRYDGQDYILYVSSYTCKADDDILYEVSVDLTDSLAVTQSAMQSKLDSAKAEILAATPAMGGDVLAQGLKYFLRKDTPDYASALVTSAVSVKFSVRVMGATKRRIPNETRSVSPAETSTVVSAAKR